MVSLKVAVIATPVAPLTVVTDPDGVVVVSGFTSPEDQLGRLGSPAAELVDDLGPASRAVAAYLDGDVNALHDVPVRQAGGPFLQEVWRLMRDIPAGTTWSYGELAAKAGNPRAVRAVGGACARNMVAPFVPCHRVVRSDGSLGGYYYGLDAKRWILAHERGEDVMARSGG
ncbi:MAG: methylated-DNA--[protein]-cysteine S-methyltransferase [Candidatus Nanopelagicales bacterium]